MSSAVFGKISQKNNQYRQIKKTLEKQNYNITAANIIRTRAK